MSTTLKPLEQSIADAMDCEDLSILPYLPYILQDFQEIGSSASAILAIVEEHTSNHANLKVLDLGCGKGAVLVRLASRLHCHCHGIDAIPEFIQEAREAATSHAVADRCRFECGDARELVRYLVQFDVIILGSIGPVFGDYQQTMTLLHRNLAHGGIIILDDGYLAGDGTADDSTADGAAMHPAVTSREAVLRQIDAAGMRLITEYTAGHADSIAAWQLEYANIARRCSELAATYSGMRGVFEAYAARQAVEYHYLEHDIICSTMVIGRNA